MSFESERSPQVISGINLLDEIVSHSADLISLVNQRLRSSARQRWIESLTEFQSGDDFFQGAIGKAKKPAKLGIVGCAPSLSDVQRPRGHGPPKWRGQVVVLVLWQT